MNNKERTNLIIIGAALIIIVLLAWLVISRNRTPSSVVGGNTQDSGSVSTATPSMSGSGELSVENQPAGISVNISSMKLSADSWVAVKDENGWILGAGLFAPNATSGVVPLLRGTMAGKTYTAVIYADNGDKAFDFHSDTLVDGVSSTFSAQ